MQAHPLSIPAALIPFQSPAPSPPAQPPNPSIHPLALRRTSAPDANPPRPSPSIPRSALIPPGIAQSSGLAHDAGNLLGALGLYCDLLRVPGVLRPEHRHYATELGLISSRSSDLIRRLLSYTLAQTPPNDLSPAPSLHRELHPESHSERHSESHTERHRNPTVPAYPEALPDPLRLQPGAVRRSTSQASDGPYPSHASVLRKLAPVLQRIAAGTAKVFIQVPTALPLLDLPVEAMERIAVNLVRNAVEALRRQHADGPPQPSQTPGEIRVALGIFAGRLQLLVEDNGPGIPPAVAAAFMHPVELPANAQRGLGHRIVHDLVTSSGGQISVRTRPGHGTVFCMKWPVRSLHALPAESEDAGLYLVAPPATAALGPASDLTAQKGLASC